MESYTTYISYFLDIMYIISTYLSSAVNLIKLANDNNLYLMNSVPAVT